MASATPAAPSAARERILSTAGTLFYRQGIRAVGVDTIIRESDVAKMTFYKHFPSKESLVVAYLQARDRQWWLWVEAALAGYAPDDPERPLVVFDALEQRLQRPFDRGCAFVNAITDLADAGHAGYRFAVQHKERVETYVRGVCEELGYVDASGLGQQIVLLLEGALVSAQRRGIAGPAHTARELARRTLADALRKLRFLHKPKGKSPRP